jgi:hypothetical protein
VGRSLSWLGGRKGAGCTPGRCGICARAAQLRRFYDAHFHLLDVGVALPLGAVDAAQGAPPPLLGRFAVPDVMVRDTTADVQRGPRPGESQDPSDASAGTAESSGETQVTKTRRRDYVRRVSLTNWLADGMSLAVVGEAGSGKSTLLRCH